MPVCRYNSSRGRWPEHPRQQLRFRLPPIPALPKRKDECAESLHKTSREPEELLSEIRATARCRLARRLVLGSRRDHLLRPGGDGKYYANSPASEMKNV